MWPVASTKRRLDTGVDDARDDHESKRHKNSDDSVSMTQEPSFGSGVRSNIESIRRADAEAGKALQRAKVGGGTTCSETCIRNADGRIGGVCDERRGNN